MAHGQFQGLSRHGLIYRISVSRPKCFKERLNTRQICRDWIDGYYYATSSFPGTL